MLRLPLRHLHLDYHTPEAAGRIATGFSADAFRDALARMHVASVNLFAKCWHGWSYHPTRANRMHPGLGFDLLGAQIAAAQAIGVRTVVYLSTGPDEKDARRLPAELKRQRDGRLQRTPDFATPGFHLFCLNTAFQERLLAEIAEVLRAYPCHGLWLDGAAWDPPCHCPACAAGMRAAGIDAADDDAASAYSRSVFAGFCARVRRLADGIRPGLGIFHNSGHVPPGQRALLADQTHLELESLPTAGWGYDHFPLSARHVRTWGAAFLGMTGRFHRGWGEFGGYKHPDALRWEAGCCLAYGGGVSIGDQLRPDGVMDEATCALVGRTCAEVEALEPWCAEAQAVGEIGLLIAEALERRPPAEGQPHFSPATRGALHLLDQCQLQFDVIDAAAEFDRYRVIMLPEGVRCDRALAERIRRHVAAGGRILACGDGGLADDGAWPVDLGARYAGVAGSEPSYVRLLFALPDWLRGDQLCRGRAHALEPAGGEILAWRRASLFPRTAERFFSHAHAPSAGVDVAPGITRGAAGIAIGWDLCRDFADHGQAATRLLFAACALRLLDGRPLVGTSLPPGAIVTVMRQERQRRTLVHLLYAPRRCAGDIEVIDEAPTLHGIDLDLRLPWRPGRASLPPTGLPLPLDLGADGCVRLSVPHLHVHAIVCLDDA